MACNQFQMDVFPSYGKDAKWLTLKSFTTGTISFGLKTNKGAEVKHQA